jgi:hypothetical protein
MMTVEGELERGEDMSFTDRQALGLSIARQLAAHFDVPVPSVSNSPYLSKRNRLGEYVPGRVTGGLQEPARLVISMEHTGRANFTETVLHEFAHHMVAVAGGGRGHGQDFQEAVARVRAAWASMQKGR